MEGGVGRDGFGGKCGGMLRLFRPAQASTSDGNCRSRSEQIAECTECTVSAAQENTPQGREMNQLLVWFLMPS